MPRDIPIGNGNLLITFDADYCLRDIYYPRVGKENHTDGHKFRIGVWTKGKLRWIDRKWELSLDYAADTLCTQVSARNQSLGAFLQCNDLVDYRENIYLKGNGSMSGRPRRSRPPWRSIFFIKNMIGF